mgnify:CR=1 FL=1
MAVTVPGDSTLFVFAYGSNMCTQRMRSRVSTAVPVTTGYVPERRIAFHKRSDDGSAKADAVFTASAHDRVWGIVYQLHVTQKPVLDRFEFLGIGYDEETVEVVHEVGTVRACMYVARRDAIDGTLLPYSWYHEFVLHGARQHRLPQPYIDHLKNFDTTADPDPARRTANLRLILD